MLSGHDKKQNPRGCLRFIFEVRQNDDASRNIIIYIHRRERSLRSIVLTNGVKHQEAYAEQNLVLKLWVCRVFSWALDMIRFKFPSLSLYVMESDDS